MPEIHTKKSLAKYAWMQWGDINAFFGLILDNVAVMIVLVVLTTSGNPIVDHCFSREFVLTQMIPGTALGVVIGDLLYTWMAFRLANRTGKSDVTAMPLGLDTPSTFAVAALVLLPALNDGIIRCGMSHEKAMVFGWHVGMAVLVMVGIFKTLISPLGSKIRNWIPRAGLLGSLAGIAIALISFVPLWTHIAAVPVVGLLSLTVILLTLVAKHTLPGKIPGALAAVVIGMIVYYASHYLSETLEWPIVPPVAHYAGTAWRAPELFPDFARNLLWWQNVILHASSYLPVILPFALATIVGGIDCTESASAVGDTYNTNTILLTESFASVIAGLFGGVIQSTPYIGQPAYKAMGGRAAYTLATAFFIGLAGILGWFTNLFEWLPEAAVFPILVFVGLEIAAQSFKATPTQHFPAVALAILPALAYLILIPLDQLPVSVSTSSNVAVTIQSLRCLSNGFIVTSLLWASALAAMIDGKLLRSAGYFGICAMCSLFGIIHSPLRPGIIALPHWVFSQMPQDAAIRCQSPYHWTFAYILAALLLTIFWSFRRSISQTGEISNSN